MVQGIFISYRDFEQAIAIFPNILVILQSAKGINMPLPRHIKKRFLLYPIYEIANFFTKRVEQSKNAHACRISTPPTRGIDIR